MEDYIFTNEEYCILNKLKLAIKSGKADKSLWDAEDWRSTIDNAKKFFEDSNKEAGENEDGRQ